jgi:hypothetical protein
MTDGHTARHARRPKTALARAGAVFFVVLALVVWALATNRPAAQTPGGLAPAATDATDSSACIGGPVNPAGELTMECKFSLPSPSVVTTTITQTVTATSTPTTPAPTSSSPSPTTSSPTPTGPPSLLKNCFSQLAACGYPTTSTTGVPAGTVLTPYTGSLTPAAGAVIDGKSIGCGLTIRNAGVVIRNSKITGPCFYGVDMEGGTLSITDSEVDCVGHQGTGIAYGGFSALRVLVRNCENGFHTGSNSSIVDSYITGVVEVNGGHGDGIQGQSDSNFVVRHNTFDLLNPITSSIIWHGLTMSNVVVEDNFFSAGA